MSTPSNNNKLQGTSRNDVLEGSAGSDEVKGREHALEQRAAGHAGGVKGGVVGEPASPGAHRGEWGDRPGGVSHKQTQALPVLAVSIAVRSCEY